MADYINGVDIGDASGVLDEAANVTLDSEGIGYVDGEVGYDHIDNADYYKFTTAASGTATISLYPFLADLDLYLYDSAGNQMDYSNYAGTSTEVLSYAVTAGETYYVNVDPYGSAESDYYLEIYNPVPSADRDDYVNGSNIGDAGDTLAAAADVPLDSNGDGTATGSTGYDSDSDDYYKFTAAGSGTATITLNGMSADLDLFVYDSAGNQVAYSNGTSNENLSYSVTAGETYYVKVDPYGTAESEYNLSIDTPVSSAGSDDYVWNPTTGIWANVGDVGDTLGSATNVTLDSIGWGASVGAAGYGSDSDDYYEFTALGSGDASFELYNLSADLDLRLYNSAGTLLSSSTAGGSTAESITYGVTEGSTYYVRVDPYSTAESEYWMEIYTPAPSTGQDDYVYDPNTQMFDNIGDAGDTLGSAANVPFDDTGWGAASGSTGYGSDSDDYYQFTVAGTGTATINMSGMSADLDLFVYGSTGALLGSSTAGGSTDESVSYDVTAGSTYYVRVDPYLTAESYYSLIVYSPVLSAGPDDYIWDPAVGDYVNYGEVSDVLASAADVPLDGYGDGSAYGSTGYGSDSDDYYKFTAASSGTATIGLTGMSADLDLFVYDSAGNQVAYSNGTSNENLSYSVTAGETYYVRVDPYGTAASEYWLDINAPAPSTGQDDYVWDPTTGYVNIGDAGDTLGSAANMPLHSDYGDGSAYGSAGYGGDGDDYYQFTAAGSGTALIEMWGMSEDLDLKLYNSAGALLGSSTAGGSTDESVSYDVTAGSTYYVRVDPYSTAESDYSLIVYSPVSSVGSDDYVYDHDSGWVNIGDAGDTLGSAANMPLHSYGGDGSAYGSAGYGGDGDDYYKFTALGSGTAMITLGAMSEDIDLRLYNSAGTLLSSSTAGGSTSESITYGVTAGSTYYVRVDPYGSAESNYVMDIFTPAPSTGQDDYVWDPTTGSYVNIGDAGNNIFLDSQYVPLDNSGSGYAHGSAGYGGDSDDYYRFIAEASGTAVIYLYDMSADLDLKLYNSAGTLLSSSTAGGTDGEAVFYDLTDGSTYYVRVDPYSTAESDYYLNIITAGSGAAGSDDYVNGLTDPEYASDLASDADSDSIALAGVDSMQIDDAWMIA